MTGGVLVNQPFRIVHAKSLVKPIEVHQQEARKRLEAGATQRSVAHSYNVSQTTISRLAT
jgi:DNA-binding transcriptional regulator LsrR (DeoR family)